MATEADEICPDEAGHEDPLGRGDSLLVLPPISAPDSVRRMDDLASADYDIRVWGGIARSSQMDFGLPKDALAVSWSIGMVLPLGSSANHFECL